MTVAKPVVCELASCARPASPMRYFVQADDR
jgi:hypothetical protein